MKSYLELPYQRVADSPSVKYYTAWQVFDEYLLSGRPAREAGFDEELLTSLGVKPDYVVTPSTRAEAPVRWPREPDTRLASFHFSNISSSLELRLEDADAVVLLGKPLEGFHASHLNISSSGDSSLAILLLSPGGARGLSTVSLNISVARGSHLNLTYAVFDSRSSATALMQVLDVGGGSAVSQRVFLSGGRAILGELSASLSGPGAELTEGVLVAGLEGANTTVVTDAVSPVPSSSVRISLLGLATSGYIAHKGVLRLHRGASGSRAVLSSRLIPLTQRARVYSSPFLEIESDDAEEARHSASHAPLGPEKIFYLRARGFSLSEAVRALLEAEARQALGGGGSGDDLASLLARQLLEKVAAELPELL